ncbi:MAG: RluA family pseudouridine synthase [Sandaracinaceae bacterium]
MARAETKVDETMAGQTLAAVVRALLDVPWSKAKRLCTSGRVFLDGDVCTDLARRVEAGAKVAVDEAAPKKRLGVLDRDAILHSDADVVVVRKDSGLLTLPFHGDEKDTLVDQTRAALARMLPRRAKGRDPMVGVVQRLDKDTTGVLVFARNMVAKRALQDQLRAHTVGRRYLALAHGAVKTESHESDIVQDRGDGLRGSWGTRSNHRGAPPPNAKRSVTHVRLVEPLRKASLVECRLETGRQHQIRIHLAEAGHPLVGERVYIRDFSAPQISAPRPMLHATELAFEHPRTGERLRFSVPLPADFEAALARLRG